MPSLLFSAPSSEQAKTLREKYGFTSAKEQVDYTCSAVTVRDDGTVDVVLRKFRVVGEFDTEKWSRFKQTSDTLRVDNYTADTFSVHRSGFHFDFKEVATEQSSSYKKTLDALMRIVDVMD